jgi:hypothetical protein
MHFPVTVVDGFYDDPNSVRELALSLDYHIQSPSYPGIRTSLLHEVAPQLTEQFCNKLFSIFYDLNSTYLQWQVSTSFHKITPYTNQQANTGLIHKDHNCLFAGVVYLNPNPDINSGTSLCQPNNTFPDDYHSIQHEWDGKLFTYTDDQIANVITTHSSMFDTTVDIKNVYNRLVLYDGDYWHKISNYTMNNDTRLNQVFFVYQLDASIPPPIIRMNNV